ncbi:N-acetylglucosaminephosphotransferase [Lentinus tigrinus ALCF2SS1-7]|uniref:UDP-N-acetylglucosamine--dolichyl-phosphate N-acetylglucosaminephosphotransferase n=1 Tax=Lentinus tigrinus ALCF2SS1-6 TaxID=1328759 RepID=A0A5C2SSN4_9APHY|nr:N-acetylglucosaminephosphotransferase [Lentinus tigrinus ALCF2SS1-6]RPD76566.1 N-acetylglucosaminephosphotransferase [Lentinus tigrinus ALCF2SS1-7]
MAQEAALRPRYLPKALLYALVPTACWFLLRPLLDPAPPLPALHASLGFSLLALLGSLYLVPALGQTFIRANLKGRDLLKTYDTPIPESQGLICASIYIILLILFIPYSFSESFTTHYDSARRAREGIVVDEFPHHQLAVYLSSLLSLLMATMLGFLDDVFDIRWRHKLPIPIIASIPLLIVYYSERGATDVVVPLPLRWLFGTLLHLGPLYYVYMSLLSTFCTNSINILAGINGSEVSQAVIIASSIILNDLLFLPWPFGFRIALPLHVTDGLKVGGMWSAGMAYGSRVLVERHLFSLYLMLPLLGVCLGFMYHNWYPARAFPGDTLCYVTGMAFAVVGIQAHYSKTLLLFFLPQIFNFVLSCPQLFGLVPCPRHRVPRYDAETQLLYPSKAEFKEKRPSKLATLVLRLFSALGLVELAIDVKTGEIESSTNLTILNVFLLRLGPMREDGLTRVLIATQVCGSLLAFFIRYGLAGLVYDGNRR